MKNESVLYGAYVDLDKETGKASFCYCELTIIKTGNDGYYMSCLCPVDINWTSTYIDDSLLDKECIMGKELPMFYSKNKSSCIKWLQRKQEELMNLYRYHVLIYEGLRHAKIQEVSIS